MIETMVVQLRLFLEVSENKFSDGNDGRAKWLIDQSTVCNPLRRLRLG